ncbi:MAG: hypothetical protein AB1637_07825 [Elusimicrobiota bacterium]
MKVFILFRRKILSLYNSFSSASGWKAVKNIIFLLVGLSLISGLYISFVRVLKYLHSVELIGEILIWKLTAMVFLMSFSMIMISSVVIAINTLYYSFDLKFLVSSPLKPQDIFADKCADTVFYSSWTLMAAMIPYVFALMKTMNLGFGFFAVFTAASLPFAALASFFGIALSLFTMYFFPSSKTRDVFWIIGSLSVAFVYAAFRMAKPEYLLRPDTLEIVAKYINFLQAPTAAYLPSWWLTKTLTSYAAGKTVFILWLFLLYGFFSAFYYAVIKSASAFYLKGLSGAQNGSSFSGSPYRSWEEKAAEKFKFKKVFFCLLSKERKTFFREIKHWSQIILIIALVFVYVFSVKNLPLDSPDMKSFICFLNIGAAGFVVSAVALRFLFTSISLEGNSFWILKSSPIKTEDIFYAKLLFYCLPTMFLSFLLTGLSNYFLGADRFIFSISLFAITVITFTLCVLGISFGAIYPDFKVENIHQVESSYGGFLFMAFSMGYIALSVAVLAGPVQMHFMSRFNPAYIFEKKWLWISLTFFFFFSFILSQIFWKIGLNKAEKYEI